MPRRNSYFDYDDDYDYFGFEPSRPIPVEDGLKARSQRGAFAKNWWAERWIEALERLMDSGRLTRGRSYARQGQVLSIDEVEGGVEAFVQGSRPKPYRVTIQIAPLDDDQWERVLDALAEQALFAAQLLAGEMPPEIETAFQVAGLSLFPVRRADLATYCSCPDPVNPCKHIAATHYILGERFDEDPFLLFRLRGRSQEQVLQGLRQRRAGQAAEEEGGEEQDHVPPLEESIDEFWESGGSLEDIPVFLKPPAIEMPLLKRLGEPSFVPQPGLQAWLKPVYSAISSLALEAALGAEGTTQEADQDNGVDTDE